MIMWGLVRAGSMRQCSATGCRRTCRSPGTPISGPQQALHTTSESHPAAPHTYPGETPCAHFMHAITTQSAHLCCSQPSLLIARTSRPAAANLVDE